MMWTITVSLAAWMAVFTMIFRVAQNHAMLESAMDMTHQRLSDLTARTESPIPTALQDWDAEYERLTGKSVA